VKIRLLFAFLVALFSTAPAWAGVQQNCIHILPTLLSDGGTKNTAGQFIVETKTYSIRCVLKPVIATQEPPNAVTAYAGEISGTSNQQCVPTWATITTQGGYVPAQSSFTNEGFDGEGLIGACKQGQEHVLTSYCPSGPCCSTDCPIPPNGCIICGVSPVILDLNGKGFSLTNAANGVSFDIAGTGNPVQMGWTARGADNAFLALPGPDGLVHNGKQLFGNFTPQPQIQNPNGFAALAVYDDNHDGVIDSQDAIFSSLRLWIDANHDGISQPGELHTLPSLGVNSLSVKYKDASRQDQYGNTFRYKARVNPGDPNSSVDRIAFDVFFVEANPTATKCTVPAKVGLLSAGK
jgi:hypothetical protein